MGMISIAHGFYSPPQRKDKSWVIFVSFCAYNMCDVWDIILSTADEKASLLESPNTVETPRDEKNRSMRFLIYYDTHKPTLRW